MVTAGADVDVQRDVHVTIRGNVTSVYPPKICECQDTSGTAGGSNAVDSTDRPTGRQTNMIRCTHIALIACCLGVCVGGALARYGHPHCTKAQ